MMRAKLKKDIEGMYFLESDIKDIPKSINVYQQISDKKARWGFGEHSGKLSFENCKAIERGYDLDELAEKHFFDDSNPKVSMYSFKVGFQKALEILGDKKYTEDNVMQMAGYMFRVHKMPNIDGKEEAKKYLQELQQTEWDVEIETTFLEEEKTGLEELSWGRLVPRLDADGCLILKRIEL